MDAFLVGIAGGAFFIAYWELLYFIWKRITSKHGRDSVSGIFNAFRMIALVIAIYTCFDVSGYVAAAIFAGVYLVYFSGLRPFLEKLHSRDSATHDLTT